MRFHIEAKRKKYLNNDSIVLGSYSYLDKKLDTDFNYHVRDFNDVTIFLIPSVFGSKKVSFKVANYIYNCFEQIENLNGFEAFSDFMCKKNSDEKLVSKYFNKGISLNEVCFITTEDYDEL